MIPEAFSLREHRGHYFRTSAAQTAVASLLGIKGSRHLRCADVAMEMWEHVAHTLSPWRNFCPANFGSIFRACTIPEVTQLYFVTFVHRWLCLTTFFIRFYRSRSVKMAPRSFGQSLLEVITQHMTFVYVLSTNTISLIQ